MEMSTFLGRRFVLSLVACAAQTPGQWHRRLSLEFLLHESGSSPCAARAPPLSAAPAPPSTARQGWPPAARTPPIPSDALLCLERCPESSHSPPSTALGDTRRQDWRNPSRHRAAFVQHYRFVPIAVACLIAMRGVAAHPHRWHCTSRCFSSSPSGLALRQNPAAQRTVGFRIRYRVPTVSRSSADESLGEQAAHRFQEAFNAVRPHTRRLTRQMAIK